MLVNEDAEIDWKDMMIVYDYVVQRKKVNKYLFLA